MNPDVIQFQCSACQTVLTVPAHMAGVSGPCPMCGQTVTSPRAAPTFGQGFAPAPPSPQTINPAPQETQFPQGGAAVPLPHMISQHLQPLGGSSPGGFLGQGTPAQPPPPPAWQQPGLGQTLLGGMPVPPTMASAGPPSGFLPPRRPEGQPPQAPAPPPSGPISWGAGAPQQPAFSGGQTTTVLPQQRGPHHSSLIPGAPTLPTLGSSNPLVEAGVHGSLLGRSIPAAAPTAPPTLPALGDASPAAVPPSRPSADLRTQRARKKAVAGRASNVFMFSLALLLLVGFLAAVGWLFREPILEIVHRYLPAIMGKEQAPVAAVPQLDLPSPVTASAELKAPAPVVAEPQPATVNVPPASTPNFDPEEPQTKKAQPATPADLVAALNPPSLAPASPTSPPFPEAKEPEATSKSTATAPGLMEVPSKTVAPGIQSGGSDDPAAVLAKSEVKLDVPPEAVPAAEALKSFLNATSLEERLKHTLAAETMRPLMERYYAAHAPGPILVDAIGLVRLDPKPQLGGGAHAVFGVESKTWEFPVPVMLEHSGGRFRVDWLSFIEFKDRLLEQFLQGYQEGPARFHVGITRTHYFDDKIPNSASKDAYRISPAPPNPFLSTVFVDKDSPLGRELRDKIPWDAQVWAIVELEWIRLGTQQWVQLSAIPQLNWYSVPAAPKATRPGSSTSLGEVPTEIQRAVPIGR